MPYNLKPRIDSRLHRLANILLLNASVIDNLGLHNGKMGIVIFFYHYSKYTNSEIYSDYAGELLDQIYDEISLGTSIDFEDGLTGIGWGIEYLVQNNFIEGDTNEVLANLDEIIYRKILLHPTKKELKGILQYQLTRYRNKDSKNEQKNQLKKHMLLCLLEECERILIFYNSNQGEFPDYEILEIIQLFLTEVNKIDLFPEKTKFLLDSIPAYLEIAQCTNVEKDNYDLSFRASEIVIRQLIYSKHKQPGTSIDCFDKLFCKIFTYIDDDAFWVKKIEHLSAQKLNLSTGLTGIGLFLLFNIPFKHPNPIEGTILQNDKLVVFFIIHNFSGAKTYADELLNYIKDKVQVFKIYLDNTDNIEFTIKKEKEITSVYLPKSQLNCPSSKYNKAIAQILFSKYKNIKDIIVHANTPEQYLLTIELKKYFNCKLVYTLHFLENFYSYVDHIAGYNRNIEITGNVLFAKMIKEANTVICVTAFAKRCLTQIYKIEEEKIKVIYNGSQFKLIKDFKLKERKEQYGFKDNDRIILYVGQLEVRKGIDKLIQAFLLVKDKYPDVKLVLAGSGDYDCYNYLTQKCAGRVHFIGKLDKDILVDFYCFSEMGILPSQFEQCSYVAIEMMQYGLPLIISNVPGLNELIIHNETGLICRTKPHKIIPNALDADEFDLALQIECMLNNRTNSRNFGLLAKENAKVKHSCEKMGENTLQVYRSL